MSDTTNPREQSQKKIIEKALSDKSFKKSLIDNPKKAISELLEISIPEGISIDVLEEKPNKLYLVLPVDKNELEIPEEIISNIQGASVPSSGSCGSCW